jgi:hypothetical protein
MNISAPRINEAIKLFFISMHGNRVRVIGDSMWPSIKNNQEIEISYTQTTLKQGYCYAFIHENRTLAHRFVFYKNGKAIFIGDRSHVAETISPDCIIGAITLKQKLFIIWIIALVNRIFMYSFFSFHICKIVRIACLFILTKGMKKCPKSMKNPRF